MNPLCRYFLHRFKTSTSHDEREAFNAALNEMDYWILYRPASMTLDQFRERIRQSGGCCKIADECLFVLEFTSKPLPIEGYVTDEDEIISVFIERHALP